MMPPSRRIICIVVATSCGERIPLPLQAGAGLMELDYLPSDKVYEVNTRTMTVHVVGYSTGTTPGSWIQVWRFNVDYTKVSDPSYFNDFR